MNRITRAIALPAAITIVAVSARTFAPESMTQDGEDGAPVEFTESERGLIARFAAAELPPDPTNRFADDPAAAHFGQYLFFDTRFSRNGQVSCATCHDPAQGFSDGKQLSEGVAQVPRHSPSLWNAAHNRWFFWDGRADSLWAQAVQPIENELEMAGSRVRLAHQIHDDPVLRSVYESIFAPLPDVRDGSRFPAEGRPVPDDPAHPHQVAWAGMAEDDQHAINRVFINVAKAIAAYERRLIVQPSPFDRFIQGVLENDAAKMDDLPPAAQRGLRLFIGRANCRLCHAGPNLTDGEFHNNGVPPLGGGPPADPARFDGVTKVLSDPFNAAGLSSDDRRGPAAERLEFLIRTPDAWGQFKTPGLRNVALSPPYMDQGQFATLEEVVAFYSTLKGQVLAGHHQETILVPLNLSQSEQSDLVAFLKSLTGPALGETLSQQPATPGLPTSDIPEK